MVSHGTQQEKEDCKEIIWTEKMDGERVGEEHKAERGHGSGKKRLHGREE